MALSVSVKRSPIVLIRTLVFIEVLSFAAYILSTGHNASKLGFYNHLFFSNFISYQSAKILILFGVQFAIIIYAFMRWYYETYSVKAHILTHQWGVLLRKEKSVPLDKNLIITTSSGPLGKLLHYGSVYIQNSGGWINISAISRPAEFMKQVEQALHPEKLSFTDRPDVAKLLSADEHEKLEFKSSLRFDHQKGQVNRDLERSAMKTIAAFLNTRGGELVIGVNGKREPVGLDQDYASIQHPSQDGFENHFTQVFNAMLGPEFRHLVKLSFHPVNGADICLIQVAPSSRPVYLKFDNNEQFFVRTGNITTALKLSEVDSYRRARWGRQLSNA